MGLFDLWWTVHDDGDLAVSQGLGFYADGDHRVHNAALTVGVRCY